MAFKTIPVTAFAQNCSLIWCDKTKEAAIVDPGGDPHVIIDAVTHANVKVTKVLLTHGHLDHVGATREIADHYQVAIVGPHPDESFWLNALDQQSQMFGFEPVDPFEPDTWLAQGDTISVGELTLEVRHCPGHTPGHVVFIDHQNKLAIVGDVLFNGSIGRTDFPRGDHQALINSIVNQLWTLDDDYQFIPGHGPLSTIGYEKRHNPFVKVAAQP
jgi:glyoxylase-like metal-dependent hydrolase (beta-lactamase superfamily II)